jgi:hypothetical protein
VNWNVQYVYSVHKRLQLDILLGQFNSPKNAYFNTLLILSSQLRLRLFQFSDYFAWINLTHGSYTSCMCNLFGLTPLIIWGKDCKGSFHFHCEVRHYLNENLSHGWFSRAVVTKPSFRTWPPRSPDLTPCYCFLCRNVKGVVYVPPCEMIFKNWDSPSSVMWQQ